MYLAGHSVISEHTSEINMLHQFETNKSIDKGETFLMMRKENNNVNFKNEFSEERSLDIFHDDNDHNSG